MMNFISHENTFLKTEGVGQFGDMEMKRGNCAILNHAKDDRELHLFKKISSGIYEYLGQFAYQSHEFVPGVDAEENARDVIQFVLKKC